MKTDTAPTGLIIEQLDGNFCPVAYCVLCGTRITNPDLGIVAYTFGEQFEEGRRVPFVVLCKPHCSMAPEYRSWLWEELSHFLVNLAFNTGLRTANDWKRATEGAQRVGGL
jgi:hypothetical protein